MANPRHRAEAVDAQPRSSGEKGSNSQGIWNDDQAPDVQGALPEQAEPGAMLFAALTRTAAAHDAPAEFTLPGEPSTDTERRPNEESTRDLHDLELRLQGEWEAL